MAPSVDMAAVIRRKDQIVEAMREGVRSNLTRENSGITVLHGRATFVGPRTVQVMLEGGETRELKAKRVFINTGTRAAVPDIEGLQEVPYHHAAAGPEGTSATPRDSGRRLHRPGVQPDVPAPG
jgi:pyruvate/2-oxoglutarate dehydrogenase complex dihydrolipoamide dehydrogenase (E3) component